MNVRAFRTLLDQIEANDQGLRKPAGKACTPPAAYAPAAPRNAPTARDTRCNSKKRSRPGPRTG